MNSRDLSMGIMFLLHTAVGILGNSSLLFYYVGVYYNKSTLKTTEVILTHMIVANFFIIVSKGIPETIATFGLKRFFNEVGCNLVLYIYRVGRSMSIGTTCLLSVFQAITICPGNSWWKDLKVKVQRHLNVTTFFCWILYLVMNLIFPVLLYTRLNSKNITRRRDFDHCSVAGPDELTDSLYVALLVFPEVLFSGFIVWSSSSIIVILYRHKQRVKYICSTSGSSRSSPETRATQNILVLVFTFLIFYTLSSTLNAYNALSYHPGRQLVNITSLLSMSFSALGPFILMSHESNGIRLCFVRVRKRKPPNAIISVYTALFSNYLSFFPLIQT